MGNYEELAHSRYYLIESSQRPWGTGTKVVYAHFVGSETFPEKLSDQLNITKPLGGMA